MTTYHSKKELELAIRQQITNNDNQAIKAMLRIYEYQSADEQRSGAVLEYNGVGFAGTDSGILTSFVEQYQTRHFLSPKQMTILKKKIGKYAHQIMVQAISKGMYIKENNVWVVANKK